MAIATDPLLNIMVPKTNRHPLEVAPWHHLLATHVVGFSVSVGNAWTPPRSICFCWAILFRNQQARISIFWKKKNLHQPSNQTSIPSPPQKKKTLPLQKIHTSCCSNSHQKSTQNYTNTPHSPQRIAGRLDIFIIIPTMCSPPKIHRNGREGRGEAGYSNHSKPHSGRKPLEGHPTSNATYSLDHPPCMKIAIL